MSTDPPHPATPPGPTEPTESTEPTEPPAPGDPTIGHLLAGRYRVTDQLARGGMARVYRARDERLERDVAAKILSAPYADDPAFVERFLSEARAAASIAHPSLVHVYDSGSDEARHFIVMELLDGHRSLRHVLSERGRLGVTEAVELGRELLAGLRVVHERGLVHSDVKAGNVLLGPGPAKLIDFGIARTPEEVGDPSRNLGSLPYMSPEQLRGEALTPASDLFSLGVVLYEAITGQLPFRAPTPEELAAAHRSGEIRPPSTLVDGVPGALDEAILRSLRSQPGAGFGSAVEMEQALEAGLVGRDEDETRIVAPQPDAEPRTGYVPPPLPAAPAPLPPPPVRAVRHVPRSQPRRSAWGLLGTLLILGAALLVVALVVVPLLRLGREGGGGPGTQSPGAGQSGAPAPTVTVPDTVGMSKEEAIAAANAAGLDWTIFCNEDPAKPEGIVRQEPPAGTEVSRGASFAMYSARIADCS